MLDLREKLDDLDKDDASKYGVEMAGVCSSRQSPSSAGLPDAAGLDAASGRERGRSG
jgi:hypothetical protein